MVKTSLFTCFSSKIFPGLRPLPPAPGPGPHRGLCGMPLNPHLLASLTPTKNHGYGPVFASWGKKQTKENFSVTKKFISNNNLHLCLRVSLLGLGLGLGKVAGPQGVDQGRVPDVCRLLQCLTPLCLSSSWVF